MTTVADMIMQELVHRGVQHVFVLPGGGAMHLVDSLARNESLTPVPLLHEQSVGVAADAYAQYKVGLGAALVTTGPGGTNVMTATVAAWLDSTPCVFISGQVKRADSSHLRGTRQFGFQEVDVVSMVASCTKAAVQLTDPAIARQQVRCVLEAATSGRPGPVWIDVPLDVQGIQIPDLDETSLSHPIDQAEHHDETVDFVQIVRLLETAERPLMLLGNGTRLSGVQDAALELARIMEMPVATSWKALDLIEDEDALFAGRPGSIAHRYANLVVQSSDLIVAIGARLDLGQVGYRHDTFAPDASVIAVDIDGHELRKLALADRLIPVEMDAGIFVRRLLPLVAAPSAGRATWLNSIRALKEGYPPTAENDADWTDGVSQYSLVDELSRQMNSEHILVPGSSGAASEVVMQAFRVKVGQRVFNTEGLGPMGFGIPAAIGGCIASGFRRTVCVDGDGGFAMSIQELSVVSARNLPISFFVLLNNGYGSIRQTSNNYFQGRKIGCDEESGLYLPDYRNVGPAMGIPTTEVQDLVGLRRAVSEALTVSGPYLVLVHIGARSFTHPRVTTRRTASGSLETSPLHHMAPELAEPSAEEVLALVRSGTFSLTAGLKN
jgi:acetolactate synthase-1/2/3 large subunit